MGENIPKILIYSLFILLSLVVLLVCLLILYWFYPETFGLSLNKWDLNDNHVSALISIVASLFTIAVPLSIQIVTSKVGNIYRDNELNETLFEEPAYIFMKRVIFILVTLSILSWLNFSSIVINFIALFVTLVAILSFGFFLGLIERYVSNFPRQVLKKYKSRIDEIIK